MHAVRSTFCKCALGGKAKRGGGRINVLVIFFRFIEVMRMLLFDYYEMVRGFC